MRRQRGDPRGGSPSRPAASPQRLGLHFPSTPARRPRLPARAGAAGNCSPGGGAPPSRAVATRGGSASPSGSCRRRRLGGCRRRHCRGAVWRPRPAAPLALPRGGRRRLSPVSARLPPAGPAAPLWGPPGPVAAAPAPFAAGSGRGVAFWGPGGSGSGPAVRGPRCPVVTVGWGAGGSSGVFVVEMLEKPRSGRFPQPRCGSGWEPAPLWPGRGHGAAPPGPPPRLLPPPCHRQGPSWGPGACEQPPRGWFGSPEAIGCPSGPGQQQQHRHPAVLPL